MLTADSGVVVDALKENAVRYIMERRLKNGGFCFYRLEEPNGSDTYSAIAALKILDVPFEDAKTVRFLKAFQQPDGSYESIYHAYYAIKGLRHLNEEPDKDSISYIHKQIRTHDVNRLPAGGISILKGLFTAIDLSHSLDMDLGKTLREEISYSVLNFQKSSTGFGHPHATLIDTFQALMILKWLGYPIWTLGAENFLKKCESEVFGFVNVPRTAPAFIEHIFAGTSSSVVLSRKPRYIERCAEFVKGCQRRNDGFSRTTHGGIATLEYTYLAVCILNSLNTLE